MPLTIDSNKSSLFYAAETSLQVLPETPVWHPLEPNSYSSFGGDTKTVMREPITATRQRAKGTVTDLDVKAGFTTDVTQDNLTDLIQGFFFANAHEKAKTFPYNPLTVGTTVTAAAAGAFTTAASLGTVPVGSILFSSGFAKVQNNALTRVTGVAGEVYSVSAYLAGVVEAALVTEAPPATASLEVVGFALSGDVLLYGPGSTFGGATVIQPLLSSAATVDFTTLGLMVGEWIYLGDADDLLSDTSATEFNFEGTGGVRNRGYCRIASITARAIVFDLAIGSVAWTLGSGTGGSCPVGTSGHVSLYFGTVIRNEPLPANIVRTTYTLQRYLGIGAAAAQQLESIAGSIPNEFALTVPSNNKLTADLSFVGMDTVQVHESALAGTYLPLDIEAPFNTSQNVFALFLYLINPALAADAQAPLFGFATDEKLTINNNTKPNKAIGVVGAFEGTVGNFDVSGSLTCYFDDISAQQAVVNNADVGLTNIFAKTNAGFILDLPLLTLSLPGLKVEKDKPIMADISHSAAPGLQNYTLLYNKFAYLPASAMAGYLG